MFHFLDFSTLLKTFLHHSFCLCLHFSFCLSKFLPISSVLFFFCNFFCSLVSFPFVIMSCQYWVLQPSLTQLSMLPITSARMLSFTRSTWEIIVSNADFINYICISGKKGNDKKWSFARLTVLFLFPDFQFYLKYSWGRTSEYSSKEF